MLPIILPIILLITEALKLVNNLIEGVPVEQRQAEALRWYIMWWPLNKRILKWMGTPDDTIVLIENLTSGKK